MMQIFPALPVFFPVTMFPTFFLFVIKAPIILFLFFFQWWPVMFQQMFPCSDVSHGNVVGNVGELIRL